MKLMKTLNNKIIPINLKQLNDVLSCTLHDPFTCTKLLNYNPFHHFGVI